MLMIRLFQFHKGTIKTCLLVANLLLILNFNSIKVRLKPCVFPLGRSATEFQFHKGTIKTSLFTDFPCSNIISIP